MQCNAVSNWDVGLAVVRQGGPGEAGEGEEEVSAEPVGLCQLHQGVPGGDSNTGNKACENLRNQVLHCWAKGYCEDAVAGYERCYHLAVNRGNLGVHAKTGQLACVREAKNMEKCLKRQRVLPKEL
ncbi:hypothetical protein A3770_13p70960 [Chloropicon primus]|uniref:Uncharacterized protein n=1 Tax=Chloropicon primus TaxID=1764295 RepID=A0A5B8MUU9_9CHLO|nr:hypothetical protein A3770_13p70960 [Chloropicon primus]|eukprot:QDZ24578.1 hypothetical protein A3770_13p70960 [Chloropicon primus]